VDYGLSLVESDITAHSNHFMLTVDGDLLVHFTPRIEPPQRCSVHCPDSGEMSAGDFVLLRKLQKSGKSLVSQSGRYFCVWD
jgi:hypothetical protein